MVGVPALAVGRRVAHRVRPKLVAGPYSTPSSQNRQVASSPPAQNATAVRMPADPGLPLAD
jgi:hypothetical protein